MPTMITPSSFDCWMLIQSDDKMCDYNELQSICQTNNMVVSVVHKHTHTHSRTPAYPSILHTIRAMQQYHIGYKMQFMIDIELCIISHFGLRSYCVTSFAFAPRFSLLSLSIFFHIYFQNRPSILAVDHNGPSNEPDSCRARCVNAMPSNGRLYYRDTDTMGRLVDSTSNRRQKMRQVRMINNANFHSRLSYIQLMFPSCSDVYSWAFIVSPVHTTMHPVIIASVPHPYVVDL